MNCAQAQTYIQESLDGILSAAQREALDAHLATCVICADHWREYRQLSRAATQWVQEPVPVSSDFTFRLMAKVEEHAAASQPSRPALWMQTVALAGFACVIGALAWAARPALQNVRLAPGDMAPDPHALQAAPNWLMNSIGDWPSAFTHLQSVIPTSAWALPVCLIALAANFALIQHARRRTA